MCPGLLTQSGLACSCHTQGAPVVGEPQPGPCAASWLCPQRRASHPLAPHGEKTRAQEGLGAVRFGHLGGLVAGKRVRWVLTGLWEKTTKAASEVLPWGLQTTYRRVAMWEVFSPFAHHPAHLSLVSESWGLKRLNFTCFSFLLPQPAWVRPSSRHRRAGSGSLWEVGVQLLPIRDAPRVPAPGLPLPSQLPGMCPNHHLLPPASSSELVSLPPSSLTLVPIRGSGHHRTTLRSACLHPAELAYGPHGVVKGRAVFAAGTEQGVQAATVQKAQAP